MEPIEISSTEESVSSVSSSSDECQHSCVSQKVPDHLGLLEPSSQQVDLVSSDGDSEVSTRE